MAVEPAGGASHPRVGLGLCVRLASGSSVNPGFDVFDRVPIKRRVQGPAAITEMRRCENIREMAERMLGRQRFDIEHVQARSGDFPRLQDIIPRPRKAYVTYYLYELSVAGHKFCIP